MAFFPIVLCVLREDKIALEVLGMIIYAKSFRQNGFSRPCDLQSGHVTLTVLALAS
jgi:hypothetical protein